MEIGRIVLTAVLFFVVYLVGYKVGDHHGAVELMRNIMRIDMDLFIQISEAFNRKEQELLKQMAKHPPGSSNEGGE